MSWVRSTAQAAQWTWLCALSSAIDQSQQQETFLPRAVFQPGLIVPCGRLLQRREKGQRVPRARAASPGLFAELGGGSITEVGGGAGEGPAVVWKLLRPWLRGGELPRPPRPRAGPAFPPRLLRAGEPCERGGHGRGGGGEPGTALLSCGGPCRAVLNRAAPSRTQPGLTGPSRTGAGGAGRCPRC